MSFSSFGLQRSDWRAADIAYGIQRLAQKKAQLLAFQFTKAAQDCVLNIPYDRPRLRQHLFAKWLEIQASGPAVILGDLATHQILLFQPVNNTTNGDSVIGDALRQTRLIKAGIGGNHGERRELHRREIKSGLANLVIENRDRSLLQPAD
jgi:hypothetical protein